MAIKEKNSKNKKGGVLTEKEKLKNVRKEEKEAKKKNLAEKKQVKEDGIKESEEKEKEISEIVTPKVVREPETLKENLEEIVIQSSPHIKPLPSETIKPVKIEPESKKYAEERKEYTDFKPEFGMEKKETRGKEYEFFATQNRTTEERKGKYELAVREREERRLPFETPQKAEEEKRYQVSIPREGVSRENWHEKEEKGKRKYSMIV